VEQELFTLPEHMSSPPVFSGVRATRSLVFMCMFCRSLFVLLYIFFWALTFIKHKDTYKLQSQDHCMLLKKNYIPHTTIKLLLSTEAVVLSVLLRYTNSDWPFGIFKHFVYYKHRSILKNRSVCDRKSHRFLNQSNWIKTDISSSSFHHMQPGFLYKTYT
jgi:hypothetical protein